MFLEEYNAWGCNRGEVIHGKLFVNLALQFPVDIQLLRLVCQLSWAAPINLNLLQIVSARRRTERGRRGERGVTTMVSIKQVTFLSRLVARVWKTTRWTFQKCFPRYKWDEATTWYSRLSFSFDVPHSPETALLIENFAVGSSHIQDCWPHIREED